MLGGFVAGGVDFSSTYQMLIGNAIQMLLDACYGISSIITAKGGGGGTAANSVSTLTGQINTMITGSGGIINAMKGIGFALAALFFLISMIELINSDRLTIELFVKFFARLAVGVAAVAYSDEIYKVCTNFGDALTRLVTNAFTSVNEKFTVPSDIGTLINSKHTGFFSAIGCLLSIAIGMLPCYLLGFAVLILTYVIAFTRLLEMGARGCFLPIAMGLMTDDGWRGAGGRYLKKFLAVCCQSAVLVVIGGLCAYLMGTLAQTVISNIQNTGGEVNLTLLVGNFSLMLGVGVAMISAMMKSIGIVNDMFGA